MHQLFPQILANVIINFMKTHLIARSAMQIVTDAQVLGIRIVLHVHQANII